MNFMYDCTCYFTSVFCSSLLVKYVKVIREKFGKAEFIIAKSVLGLVYMQALVW
jgi:hypothetical protein